MSGNDPSVTAETPSKKPSPKLRYVSYGAEKESPFLPAIRQLISNDLSEPYSIYVYRYFLYQWGHLCFMVRSIHLEVALIRLLFTDIHSGSG
jgi:peptide alpha-N-acetyltransferase